MDAMEQEQRARLDAAQEWLAQVIGERLAAELESEAEIRARIDRYYPGNTPGQDGWSSFLEDHGAGGDLARPRRR
jgi:hypothetical protein